MNDAHQNGMDPTQDPEMASIHEALDELGRRDRRSAPADLEERIFARTRQTKPASSVLARIGPAWRLAAAVGIGAMAIAATWYGLQSSPTPTPAPEGEFDMIAFEAEFDAWLSDLESPSEDVESMAESFSTVEEAYADFWTDTLALSEESL